jgi:hypothetical protein
MFNSKYLRRALIAAFLVHSVFAEAQIINPGGAPTPGNGTTVSGSAVSLASTVISCSNDNSICTSSVDASRHPNFLGTAANTTLPINGGTTPLVMYIGGTLQSLSSNVTLTVPSTAGQYWILATQDTTGAISNGAYPLVAADFLAMNTVPKYQKTVPTCPSPGTALSATNPAFWFDLSSNQSKLCTSNGGSYVASPAIVIGFIDVNSTPAIDVAVAEPYRLNPYMRFGLFGSGIAGAISISSSAVIGGASTVSLGAGGSGFTHSTTVFLTLVPCGAVISANTNSSGVVASLNGISNSQFGFGCMIANGYATTTTDTGSGATINVTANVDCTINEVGSLAVTGGTLTGGTAAFGTSVSARCPGLLIVSQNPVMIINSGIISANAMGFSQPGTVTTGQAGTSGGYGGLGGGGGGAGATNAGAGGGCGQKMANFQCSDNAAGGTVGNVGANAGFGPPWNTYAGPYIDWGNAFYVVWQGGYGSGGGPGGGDGTNAGGCGGGGGGMLAIRAPAIFIASTASLTANGGNGCNGAAGNAGGGGAGGGGTVDIAASYISFTQGSTTITAAPGAIGNGVGTGKNGGTGSAGEVIIKELW